MGMGLLSRAAHPTRAIPTSGDRTDADLLDRFVAHRDHEAFADLVCRHGPMVFGVCRRVLRDPHDAEEAFQVTFLVLVPKAGLSSQDRPHRPVGVRVRRWLALPDAVHREGRGRLVLVRDSPRPRGLPC
jgi:hypothetical protein